jgi:hypothetical protein
MKDEMGMPCSMNGKKVGNACKTLIRKLTGKRPLARPRRRWENNIKIYFKEVGWQGVIFFILCRHMDHL